MSSSMLLLEKGQLEAIRTDLVSRLHDAPAEIMRQVKSEPLRQVLADDLLQHHIPFFFEINGLERGSETPDGIYAHFFDSQDKLVMVEKRRPAGDPDRWIYRLTDDSLTMYQIETFRAQHRVQRVSISGQIPGDLGYDMSTDRQSNATAYVWRPAHGMVETMQVWNMSLSIPDTIMIQYTQGAPSCITRGTKKIWKAKPTKKGKRPRGQAERDLERLATRLVGLVRAQRPPIDETVIAYTVCAEIGNTDYLPPQIGVVFQRDAEALLATPALFPDGVNSLLDPTLQEGYPFPTRTSYPYVEVEATAGEDWDWDAGEMGDRLSALVQSMNRLRATEEPPFLLVDLEDDPLRFLSALDERDRSLLRRHGLAK